MTGAAQVAGFTGGAKVAFDVEGQGKRDGVIDLIG